MKVRKNAKQIIIDATRKELKRLQAAADRAKKECDENITIGSTIIDLNKEMVEVAASKKYDAETLAKLEDIDKRYKAAKKVLNKDLVKLCDKQVNAEHMRDVLAAEIASLEFFYGLTKPRS